MGVGVKQMVRACQSFGIWQTMVGFEWNFENIRLVVVQQESRVELRPWGRATVSQFKLRRRISHPRTRVCVCVFYTLGHVPGASDRHDRPPQTSVFVYSSLVSSLLKALYLRTPPPHARTLAVLCLLLSPCSVITVHT